MDTGTRIGDYEILGELGRGGMGRVFRVRNVIAGRVEAMKVVLPDLAGRQDLAARFLREIKVLAALNHPNIAALRTAMTAGSQLVMIMEYVDGQSLAQRLERGPIDPADAVAYLDQVLDALAYAHGQGVIHRDVKPANMMLTPGGVVKLTDFGIARSTSDETLTGGSSATGSLSYMSPEQVNGEATDARSDLYSVGVSLYEMVTGQRPFKADSDFHVMLAHLKQPPRPPIELQPALPRALNEIILRSIAKDPKDRFQSADEFRRALRSLEAAGRPASGPAATLADGRTLPTPPLAARGAGSGAGDALPMPQPRSGHPLVFVALGAVLIVVALVGTGLYLGRADADAPGPANPVVDAPSPSAPMPAASEAMTGAAEEPAAAPPTSAATAAPAASDDETAAGALPPTPEAGTAERFPAAASTPSPSRPPAAPARAEPAAGQNAPAPQAPVPAAESPADASELEAIEAEIGQLAARAAAVDGSLDRLRDQQARQGLGLRGDVTARQASMRVNLARAHQALEEGNLPASRKYLDGARRDIEELERFLGR